MITLDLGKMSTKEKIQAMEMIWEDLSRNAGKIKSPEWHGKLLNERERNLKEGKDEFQDWDQAKEDIRNSIS